MDDVDDNDGNPSQDRLGETPDTQPSLGMDHDGVLNRIGRYRITRRLGSGGMGVVYAAVDSDNQAGPEVAIKILRRDRELEEDGAKRFQREIQATRKLDHPGIVRVLDAGTDRDFDFYVMELIEGQSLDRWSKRGEAGIDQRLALLAKVARAIDHAHQREILHRDLKPQNIIIDRRGGPHVMDFGLAREMSSRSQMTHSSSAIGTPAYMSPEQAKGQHKDCGPTSDIWALGVVMYELLTGTVPFHGTRPLEVMHAIVNFEPVNPSRLQPDLPAGADNVVMQCLEKNPARRYASGAALANDIDALRLGKRLQARRYGTLIRLQRRIRRKALPIAVISLTVMLLALLVGGAWWQRYQEWGRWTQLYSQDFTQEEPDLSMLGFFTEDLVETRRPWQRDEGGLYIPRGEWLWLTGLHEAGDVKVVATIHSEGPIDGLEFCINSQRTDTRHLGNITPGYSCQFGGYAGTVEFISRNVSIGADNRQRFTATPSRLRTNTDHHVVFERNGDDFLIRIDDQVVNRQTFPLPLAMEGLDGIGLHSYGKHFRLRKLAVYRLAPGKRINPLSIADTLARSGRWDDAINEYQLLADAYPGSTIAERALAKGYLACHALPEYPAERAAVFLARLERQHPNSPALAEAIATRAEASWAAGRIDRALDLAQRALSIQSDNRVMLRCIATRRTPLSPDQAKRCLELLAATRNCEAIDLDSLAITDLTPLAGQQLAWLDARTNQISSLEALRGMPLRYINVARNPISDLTPLAGAPIGEFSGSDMRLTDADVVASWDQLRRLDLSRNQLTSFPVLMAPALSSLELRDNPLSSFGDLSACPNLEILHVQNNKLTNIDFAANNRKLNSLMVDNNQLTELAACASMPLLDLLHARNNQIANIGALQQCVSLRELDLSANPITDLSPLAGLESLQVLNLAQSPIRDLSPLAECPNLRTLDCSDTAQLDLTPLAALDLQELHLLGSATTDLRPLALRPPQCLSWDARTIDAKQLEHLAEQWDATGHAELARCARAGLAWSQQDWDTLRALVSSGPLVLPIPDSWSTWRETNLPPGIQLMPLDRRAGFAQLNSMPWAGVIWLGIEVDGNTFTTLDGGQIGQPDYQVWGNNGSLAQFNRHDNAVATGLTTRGVVVIMAADGQ
ncbi:MAG: protein kinase [Planctomycetota bacterium]|jgi:Leucine-rich repeat (LRR) protein/predicted Ser/Thr protein kinase|nr:protein kinase [Planctomycetota bacterium]